MLPDHFYFFVFGKETMIWQQENLQSVCSKISSTHTSKVVAIQTCEKLNKKATKFFKEDLTIKISLLDNNFNDFKILDIVFLKISIVRDFISPRDMHTDSSIF